MSIKRYNVISSKLKSSFVSKFEETTTAGHEEAVSIKTSNRFQTEFNSAGFSKSVKLSFS